MPFGYDRIVLWKLSREMATLSSFQAVEWSTRHSGSGKTMNCFFHSPRLVSFWFFLEGFC